MTDPTHRHLWMTYRWSWLGISLSKPTADYLPKSNIASYPTSCNKIEIPSHPDFVKDNINIELLKNPESVNTSTVPMDILTAVFNTLLPKSIYILEQLEYAPLDKSEIFRRIGVSNQTYSKRKYLDPLLESGLIEMTQKETPRSRIQKYQITEDGRIALHSYKAR